MSGADRVPRAPQRVTGLPQREPSNGSAPPLRDSEEIARYLLGRFARNELGATGALLLDQNRVPLGTLILELRPEGERPALPVTLAGATALLVPFLFRPAEDPMVNDEEIEMFCELLETPLIDVTVPDAVYVWSTGHYLARSTAGRLTGEEP